MRAWALVVTFSGNLGSADCLAAAGNHPAAGCCCLAADIRLVAALGFDLAADCSGLDSAANHQRR